MCLEASLYFPQWEKLFTLVIFQCWISAARQRSVSYLCEPHLSPSAFPNNVVSLCIFQAVLIRRGSWTGCWAHTICPGYQGRPDKNLKSFWITASSESTDIWTHQMLKTHTCKAACRYKLLCLDVPLISTLLCSLPACQLPRIVARHFSPCIYALVYCGNVSRYGSF